VDNAEVSLHRLATPEAGEWSIEVRAAQLRLRVFGGPRPADALRRFTAATGRQPLPAAAWFYGPWFQTGHANQVPLEREREIRRAAARRGGARLGRRDAHAPAAGRGTRRPARR
jgi:alpha-glucosidase (family GH31 glycosyl hydrolase)